MERELTPKWSDEERAAGERSGDAWEDFFASGEDEPQHGGSPLGADEARKVSDVRARYEDELLRYPNVVGVATGIRKTKGKPTGEPCLVIYVERKVPADALASNEVLPAEIEGVLVDVVEAGRVEPLPA